MKKIAHGAEAIISKQDNVLLKDRIKKSYRLQQIDEKLREKRTRLEARLMREARRAGVTTPQILEESKFSLKMEFIDGKRVKDVLNKTNYRKIAERIGKSVALLHTYDIIHGDLTTSNIIIKSKWKPQTAESDFDLYFIDFGLGFLSKRTEDKATDMHLLHEAIESTHFDILDEVWKIILDAYEKNYEEAEKVIKTLSKIEKRGRYVVRK